MKIGLRILEWIGILIAIFLIVGYFYIIISSDIKKSNTKEKPSKIMVDSLVIRASLLKEKEDSLRYFFIHYYAENQLVHSNGYITGSWDHFPNSVEIMKGIIGTMIDSKLFNKHDIIIDNIIEFKDYEDFKNFRK